MLNTVKTISSLISDTGSRIIKILRFGNGDVKNVNQLSPYGIDSVPIKDMAAVYASTKKQGNNYVIGYINKKVLAEVGEIRLFSTDDSGDEQIYVHLKNDGTLELGGANDNAVRFSELESAFNELKNDLNNFILKYNTHTHAGAVPIPANQGAPSTADMSASKIDEIKTI